MIYYSHEDKFMKREAKYLSVELSLSSVQRVISKAGAEKVGKDASEELARVLEEIGVKIAKQAVELSSHAGRKTVKARDVKMAVREILKRV